MANALYELSVNQHDQAGNFFMSRVMWEFLEPSAPDPFQIANDLITAWQTNIELAWSALQGSDVEIDFYKCRRVKPTGGPSALKLSGTFGTGPTVNSTAGVSADIQAQNSNPSNRAGHIFIGGTYDGSLQSGAWIGGFQTKAATLITALTTGLTVGAVTAVWSILEKKISAWTHVTHALLHPKPTLLNKRTVPLR